MLLQNNTSEDFLSRMRTTTEIFNSLFSSIGKLSYSVVKIVDVMNSLAIKWLQSIDFSPLLNALKIISGLVSIPLIEDHSLR